MDHKIGEGNKLFLRIQWEGGEDTWEDATEFTRETANLGLWVEYTVKTGLGRERIAQDTHT